MENGEIPVFVTPMPKTGKMSKPKQIQSWTMCLIVIALQTFIFFFFKRKFSEQFAARE